MKCRTYQIPAAFCWAIVAVIACGFAASADDAKPPAGVRVFYTGHSFHMFVPPRVEQLVKSAGIEGHKLVGTQGIGGSRVIQHWELADDKNKRHNRQAVFIVPVGDAVVKLREQIVAGKFPAGIRRG